MESDLHHHQNQQSLNSGLMRYRSAPSTLLANFVGSSEAEVCDDFLQPRSSSPEAESMFARFMSCGGNSDSVPHHLRERREKSPASAAINHRNSMFMPSIEQETEIIPEQNGYSHSSQLIYQTPPPQPPIHSSAAMESSYRAMNSVGMDNQPQLKPISGNCSNLIRHSSSPAGLFSNLSVDNGYAVFRGMGNFRGVNGEAAPSTSRFKDRMNFSSETPSSSALISQISEIDSESVDATSPDKGSLGNGNGGNRCYIPGFPIGSWDDSSIASDDFSGLKRAKLSSGLNSLETQNGEITGNRAPGLTHHFSLPKTSAEMATIEKLLQLQDSVPCKIRAKRGCATHPRSIAERVRRTRISERMRKLQELVPNMDKQTNTADMLDLAVDYIKDLQKQVTTLTDNRAKCTCSSK